MPDTEYNVFKQRTIEDAFARYGHDKKMLRPLLRLPLAARRRAEWKVAAKNGVVTLGYFERASHALVDIERCPILRPELEALIAPLKASLLRLPALDSIEGVQATLAEQGIDLTLLLVREPNLAWRQAIPEFAASLRLARLNLKIADQPAESVYAPRAVTIRLGARSVPLPPGIFLQATEEAQAAITEAVLAHLRGAKRVLDLFAGLGTYGFALSAQSRVLAFEGERKMTQALQAAANGLGLGMRLEAKQRDLFRNPLLPDELNAYDGVVINPPRAGAKAQAEALARSKVPKIVMVSCNPETCARDLGILARGGYELLSAAGIDQFAFSPHVEVVALLARKNRR